MHVVINADAGAVSYTFGLDEGDRDSIPAHAGRSTFQFRPGTCRFILPSDWRMDHTHPDLIAAVALAIGARFAKSGMRLPFGVSSQLRQHVAERYKIEVNPVDPALRPRQAGPNSRPGLCFSSGVDSTAALQLLPPDTVLVFSQRIAALDGRDGRMYCEDAGIRGCQILKQAGREVWIIPTDVEFMCESIGFFNDLVIAAPVLLLADYLGLDSIAFGLILESSYLNKAFRYREYTKSSHHLQHGGLSAAAGMPWNLVTAGLSEVVTTRLVLESPYQHLAQSCVRGFFSEPCMNCAKCFRKSLLESALAGETLPDAVLDQYFQIRDARRELSHVPIKHEDVIMFILQRYRGDHPEMRALARTLRADEVDLGWMERWYTPSREVLADMYRDDAERRITARVQPMSSSDIANVKAWDRIADAEAAGRLAHA
ncbi:MAG: DUF6395 domain-containing protein [Planctomycetota bacterium]